RHERATRHRPELALELALLRRPHPRQAPHELVPALLGDVRARVEPGQLRPRRRPAGADLDAAAREDVEHRRPLRDFDRMVELRHAHDDAEPDPDPLRHHRARRQEQLRRGTVGVFLQEVVLDRPHLIESELVGELHLLERVVVDGPLRLTGPRTRHGELVEESEFHERAFLGRAWLESPRSQRYSCSPRCFPTQRPRTKNTSLRRFRNRSGHSPIGSWRDSARSSRSARRHTVRAWWRNPLMRPPPGRTNDLRGGRSFWHRSMSSSSSLTSPSPTLYIPS